LQKSKISLCTANFSAKVIHEASFIFPMLIIHVHVSVKPEVIEAFRLASVENSRKSLQEPGIARFDVLQEEGNPTRFILVEVYRTPEAPAAHKETEHYAKWRDTVADMMAEPRRSVRYSNIAPGDEAW
jgi:quinol monooxygenase YgiN